jgi:hypothetical protein
MPRTSPDFVPTYRKHKSTGQAVVTLDGRTSAAMAPQKAKQITVDSLPNGWRAARAYRAPSGP